MVTLEFRLPWKYCRNSHHLTNTARSRSELSCIVPKQERLMTAGELTLIE